MNRLTWNSENESFLVEEDIIPQICISFARFTVLMTLDGCQNHENHRALARFDRTRLNTFIFLKHIIEPRVYRGHMDEMDYRSNVLEVGRDHLPSFCLRRKDDTERRIRIWDRRIAKSKNGDFLCVGDTLIEAATGTIKKGAVNWKNLLLLRLAFLCALLGR